MQNLFYLEGRYVKWYTKVSQFLFCGELIIYYYSIFKLVDFTLGEHVYVASFTYRYATDSTRPGVWNKK